jgi:hypothetical protein
VRAIREAVIKGWTRPRSNRSGNRAIHAVVGAFRNALDDGETLTDAMDAAIAAAAAAPVGPLRDVGVASVEDIVMPPAPLAPEVLQAGHDELIRELEPFSVEGDTAEAQRR